MDLVGLYGLLQKSIWAQDKVFQQQEQRWRGIQVQLSMVRYELDKLPGFRQEPRPATVPGQFRDSGPRPALLLAPLDEVLPPPSRPAKEIGPTHRKDVEEVAEILEQCLTTRGAHLSEGA